MTKDEISIKECLIENEHLTDSEELERFKVKIDDMDDTIQISDIYDEIPKVHLEYIGEATSLVLWLNDNVKPKTILEQLYRTGTDNETLCKKVEEYLRSNSSFCSVRSDSIFFILSAETDDETSLQDAFKLLEFDNKDIEYKGKFRTDRYEVSLTNVYIKWSTIKNKWSIL